MLGDLLSNTLEELSERLDGGLLPGLYRAASVPTVVIRAQLEAAGLAYTDPATGRLPDRGELDAVADRLIRESSRLAAIRGGASAFGGLATLAPEMAAAVVQCLRLAQRLAVLYGHDPESDTGRLLLTRALSAAWELDLPTEGNVTGRLRQLPDVVRSRLSRPSETAKVAARAVAVRAVSTVGKRVGRAIPGFGTTLGAVAARRELRAQGARMLPVFQRAWKGDLRVDGEVVDATEVR